MPNQSSAAVVPVAMCSGTPRERGEQHGEALRELIAAGLGALTASIAATHTMEPDAYIRAFIHGTDFLPAIRRWTPELEAEIAGIARGSGQPWEWIFAYNLLDEEWTWARARLAGAVRGCTSVGVTRANQTPLLAQTMDIPNFHDGTQAVLRITRDGSEALTLFTYAGMLGLTGCNDAGVAVVVNNLDMLPSSASGLPVAFAIRGALERRTRRDAVDFLRAIPHATGQHYGIGAPDGLASVEGWATGVAVQAADEPLLLHTNHPLYTDETTSEAEARYQRSNTRARLHFLEREARHAQDVAGVQTLLADRTVPVSLDAQRPSMTFGAVVYECSVPPRMWLAPGPPHQTQFHRVDDLNA